MEPFDHQGEDNIFIKEGLSLTAALFGPFWSLMNNMWVEVGLHVGLLILGTTCLEALGFNPGFITAAILASNLVFALFARDLQRFYLERRGYRLAGVVVGKTLDECETRFYRTAEQQQRKMPSEAPHI